MRRELRFSPQKTINFNPEHTFHLKEAPASNDNLVGHPMKQVHLWRNLRKKDRAWHAFERERRFSWL
jgi:hypothetical protein